jgi:hypothetical protein
MPLSVLLDSYPNMLWQGPCRQLLWCPECRGPPYEVIGPMNCLKKVFPMIGWLVPDGTSGVPLMSGIVAI